jgi:hypothetical protein
MSFVIALVTVNLLAFRDTARFRDESEVSSLTFGLPLGWLQQDQSAFDRPFPGTTTFSSPWEHPFSVEFVPLLLDSALVMSLLLVAWLVVRAVRS